MLVFIIVILVLEGKGIIARREWKEIVTVTVLVFLALAYGIDYSLELSLLPDPKTLIYKVFPLGEQFESFFHLRH
jgi:uncharacterized membrane protein YczE